VDDPQVCVGGRVGVLAGSDSGPMRRLDFSCLRAWRDERIEDLGDGGMRGMS
jgi:hypothetical protein